jgi:hypothetical protein
MNDFFFHPLSIIESNPKVKEAKIKKKNGRW